MPTTTSADGTVIAYDIQGAGPVLIYITGALCHRTMREVVRDGAVFADRFTVVTYDRRGRGDSGETGEWSLARELEDIEALVRAVGGHARLYGHSSGAVLAAHTAARLGDSVDAIALYDASWAADDDEARDYAALVEEVDGLLRDDRRPAAIRRFLLGIGMPKPFALLLPLLPGWATMKRLAPTLRYDMALTASPPPLETIGRIHAPLRVMVGQRSPRELHRVAHAIAAVHRMTPTVVAGQDHLVAPKVVLPILAEALPDERPPLEE